MANDKEFLIRVKADIKDALDQIKQLSDGLGKAGNEGGQAGNKLKTLQNRLEPAAAAARKFKKELALLDSEYKKGSISSKKHSELTAKLKKEQLGAADSSNKMGRSMQTLTRGVLAYISLRSAIAVLKDADAYGVLQQRIKTATKATGDYAQVSGELQEISTANGVALRDTVSLFQNLARTAPELNATNDEILTLTNLVQQLGVIGGSTQSQLSSGLLQFSQGLAGGVFRAEEFNSIIENIPELAARIAKGLGKSTGELRRAVIEGKVLSTDVFDALKKQSGEINAEFSGIATSMERVNVSMSDSITRYLGLADKQSGVTNFFKRIASGIANVFQSSADDLDNESIPAMERRLIRLHALVDQYLGQDYQAALPRVLKQINELNATIAELSVKGDATKIIDPIETNKQQDSVNKLIEKLRTQRETLNLTNEELVIYQLNLAHASDSEIELALRIINETEARKKQQALMAEGTKVIQDNKTEMDELADTLARLDFLYEKGALGTTGSAAALDNYSRAIFNATENLEDFGETGKDSFDELKAATLGWGKEFSNTLADMVVDGKGSFKDLADAIIKDILRILIYQALIKPVLQGTGLIPPGTTNAPTKHTGGIAGSGSGSSRNVSPLVFSSAPRYHNGGIPGLRSNEVPTILEKGEEVLTRNDPRHILNQSGGSQNVKVELINKGSPSEATQANSRFDGKDIVVSIILDDLDRNGQISNAMNNKFGKR